MNRRSVLAVTGCARSGIVVGCSSDGCSRLDCHLMHEAVESVDDYGEVIETYSYEDVSGVAQRAVGETSANGSDTITNRSEEPPEFRYWDTTSVYAVIDRDETHILLPYTGEGCDGESVTIVALGNVVRERRASSGSVSRIGSDGGTVVDW